MPSSKAGNLYSKERSQYKTITLKHGWQYIENKHHSLWAAEEEGERIQGRYRYKIVTYMGQIFLYWGTQFSKQKDKVKAHFAGYMFG